MKRDKNLNAAFSAALDKMNKICLPEQSCMKLNMNDPYTLLFDNSDRSIERFVLSDPATKDMLVVVRQGKSNIFGKDDRI
ncbi:MAG: hypothetical protein AB9873_19895 [Syntrophobacteraceae bacterium]